jgi:hypothetical protein
MEEDVDPGQGNSGTRREDREGVDEVLIQLEIACCNLEESINRMPKSRKEPDYQSVWKIKEKSVTTDDRRGGSSNPREGEKLFGRSMRICSTTPGGPYGRISGYGVSKPMVMGAQEYPAPADEIKREGWRARRVTRVNLPPPLTQSFAATVEKPEMARREQESGGGGQSAGSEMRGRAEESTGTKAGGALGKKLAGRSISRSKACEVKGSSNSGEEEVVEKGSNLHRRGQ